MKRKHYNYPDLPKGYQITSEPIGEDGKFVFEDGSFPNIGIWEAHLEEDPGQYNLTKGLVDYNRSGVPLIEIVTAPDIKSAEQAKALCDNKIDAMVFTVGHPSGSIKEPTTTCDSVIVPVTGPAIDKLVKENAYYRTATIPGGMYRGTSGDVQTFGVGATFVTSAKVPENVIYNVVKAVFENFDQFKKLHPAFKILKKEEMIKDGLSAPLHKGAVKYYKEAGLM